jgi:hypothetical protein
MTNQYDKIVNQYIEILLYDIDIKFYELKKNKINVEIADKIFDCYYEKKINEFKNNLKLAKKIFVPNYDVEPKPPSFRCVEDKSFTSSS